jgi:hypothetical protein
MTTIEQLAAELDAADAVPVAWRAAFLSVPRHHFLPPQVWVDDDAGRPQPLSRDDGSDQWRQAAYRNVPILIQFDEDGTATGSPVGRVGFMAMRSQRTPGWTLDHLDPEDPAAEVSTTTLDPWRVAESHDVRWAIGTRVRHCVWDHQPPTDDRMHHLLWLLDPVGGSWAVARYDGSADPRLIRQHGPRRLWDEVEAAFRSWAAEGKPPLDRSRITVTPNTQTVL